MVPDLRCEQDDAATRLTCSSCDDPVCPRCFVRTPVGFKCRSCLGAAGAPPPARSAPSWAVATLVGVVGALALVGWRLLGAGDQSPADLSARYPGRSARDVERPFLGEPGNDGSLTFTATGFECDSGSDGAVEERIPQGRFCTLALTVRNTGTQPETFVAAEQLLVDAESRSYRPDPDGASATRVVNPGNELTATLIFDVPPEVTPGQAELHRVARSPGVRVLLRPR